MEWLERRRDGESVRFARGGQSVSRPHGARRLRKKWTALLAAALCAGVIAAPGTGFAVPIAGSSVDLSDPEFLFLKYGAGDGFTIAFAGSFVNAPFTGTVGDTVHFEVDLTLDVLAEVEEFYQGGLMVFTSIRVNNPTPLDCGNPSSFPQRLPFSMLNMQGDTLTATDLPGPAGQICDLEDQLNGSIPPFGPGVQFQAFQFAGNPGDSHHISFDLQVSEDFSTDQLNEFLTTGIVTPYRGFAITPEPNTSLLVLAGLAVLAANRRARKN